MFWLKLGMVAIYTEMQDLLGDDIGEQACDSTSESRFFFFLKKQDIKRENEKFDYTK